VSSHGINLTHGLKNNTSMSLLYNAKIVAKENPNIQVKDKLQGKECWLRKVFRLIVIAIDEIKRPSMNHKNHLDECLTYKERLEAP
jgi:hypothetical protein